MKPEKCMALVQLHAEIYLFRVCGKAVAGFLKGMVIVFLALWYSATAVAAERSDIQFTKQPEIQQVRPQKPVKIRLHRNAKGEYSWDLDGDNVDEIVNTDKKLRRLLKVQ
jgi:hypothetical protein